MQARCRVATATAIAGRYAYVPGYSSGVVAAVDLLDPGHPAVAGTSAFASSLVNATNITIANGFAYVVSKNRNGPSGSNSNDDGTGNSLTILDIATDPSHPAIVGSVHDAVRLFGSYGVAVQGQYAYVAAQGCLSGQPCPNTNVGDAFTVVDISNPAAPTVVAIGEEQQPSGAVDGERCAEASDVGRDLRPLRLRDRLVCEPVDGTRHLEPACAGDRRLAAGRVEARLRRRRDRRQRLCVRRRSGAGRRPRRRRRRPRPGQPADRRRRHELDLAERRLPDQDARASSSMSLRHTQPRSRRSMSPTRPRPDSPAATRAQRCSTALPASTSTRPASTSSPSHRSSPPPPSPPSRRTRPTRRACADRNGRRGRARSRTRERDDRRRLQARQPDLTDLGQLQLLHRQRRRDRAMSTRQPANGPLHLRDHADLHLAQPRQRTPSPLPQRAPTARQPPPRTHGRSVRAPRLRPRIRCCLR